MIENLIIIPYRNREKHLDKFISSTIPLLKEELSKCKIVIIEQTEDSLFNRGALINIGYDLFKDDAKFIITHDVDLYPTHECIRKFYSESFDGALGICCSPCNTLGGIVKIPVHYFEKVNGFPNNFWGWGIEDKAFQNRVEHHNIPIKKEILRNRSGFLDFFLTDTSNHERLKDKYKHNMRHRLHYDKWPIISKEKKNNLIYSSGLNNLKYKICKELSSKDYEHFIIEIFREDENIIQKIWGVIKRLFK